MKRLGEDLEESHEDGDLMADAGWLHGTQNISKQLNDFIMAINKFL